MGIRSAVCYFAAAPLYRFVSETSGFIHVCAIEHTAIGCFVLFACFVNVTFLLNVRFAACLCQSVAGTWWLGQGGLTKKFCNKNKIYVAIPSICKLKLIDEPRQRIKDGAKGGATTVEKSARILPVCFLSCETTTATMQSSWQNKTHMINSDVSLAYSHLIDALEAANALGKGERRICGVRCCRSRLCWRWRCKKR